MTTNDFIEQYKQGNIPKSTIIKMAALKGEIEKLAEDSRMPKSWGGFKGSAKQLGYIALISALAGGVMTAGAKGLEKLDEKLFDDKRKLKAFKDMTSKFPELLRDNDKKAVVDYFSSLWHFSPHIANDPMAARSYIKHALTLHEVGGPTYMTYKDLISAQEKAGKTKDAGPLNTAMQFPLAQVQQFSGPFDKYDYYGQPNVSLSGS